MNNIDNIYRIQYLKNHWNYVGTLRNEKKFNLKERVFFAIGTDIYFGEIIGIELPPEENPSYLYKIHIPDHIVQNNMRDPRDFYFDDKVEEELKYIVLQCDCIFHSIDEAKESAIKDLNNRYELQLAEIERYFDKYKKENKHI